jgi:hypothetical protein
MDLLRVTRPSDDGWMDAFLTYAWQTEPISERERAMRCETHVSKDENEGKDALFRQIDCIDPTISTIFVENQKSSHMDDVKRIL